LTLATGATDIGVAQCPAGYFPTGGGAVSDDESNTFITIAESGFAFDDAGNPNGWLVVARSTDAALTHDVLIMASCVKPTQVTAFGAGAAQSAGVARKLAR